MATVLVTSSHRSIVVASTGGSGVAGRWRRLAVRVSRWPWAARAAERIWNGWKIVAVEHADGGRQNFYTDGLNGQRVRDVL